MKYIALLLVIGFTFTVWTNSKYKYKLSAQYWAFGAYCIAGLLLIFNIIWDLIK